MRSLQITGMLQQMPEEFPYVVEKFTLILTHSWLFTPESSTYMNFKGMFFIKTVFHMKNFKPT